MCPCCHRPLGALAEATIPDVSSRPGSARCACCEWVFAPDFLDDWASRDDAMTWRCPTHGGHGWAIRGVELERVERPGLLDHAGPDSGARAPSG